MTSPASPAPRRAAVVGTGLIGGSIGLALRRLGWHVTGHDQDERSASLARQMGAVDEVGIDPAAEITFIATPVRAVAAAARDALGHGPGIVTDVGSVKGSIVEAIDDPRFLGGHPMAGSEQEGVEGADADLFAGAVWVLTPTAATDDATYATLRGVLTELGADVVALAPEHHDALVAVVSHVPHLTAATLMGLADDRSTEHRALLRLAAGGFRDMTRIASGHPGIWPDICAENRSAILDVLDGLVQSLQDVRSVVADGDRAGLLAVLEQARAARANLPSRLAVSGDLREVRIPVPDRPGVLAEVTTLAGTLDVNIADLEIAHSSEGERGVLILLVEEGEAERLRAGLVGHGFRPAVLPLG
ncbi:MAG: prephenate dehydrogenase/arogenate dehydrogenase family protein [Acidimicrobiales bacterium]|nr:prephenate dehydrogenase/arogenate dehydrogenase family protein [Acidimicrobiales bacterium]